MKKKKAPKTLNEWAYFVTEIVTEAYNGEIEPGIAKVVVSGAATVTKITQLGYLQAQAAGVVNSIDFMNHEIGKPMTIKGLSIAEAAGK